MSSTAHLLGLAPHPEGGWYKETWRCPVSFSPPGYPSERAAATGIYFLLGPGERSRWHRVRSDEVWLWHSGGPLRLRFGGTGDEPAFEREEILGPDLVSGQRPQILIPGGVWQSAEPAADHEALMSCIVAPGFDFADFTLAQ